MMELITAAFSPVNVVFTVLLLLVVLYWVLMILGALDLEFLTPDVEADLDVDVDADVDVDVDADIDTGLGEGPPAVGVLDAFLQFFYIGKVPMMVLISILALSLWVISLTANRLVNPWNRSGLGLAIAVGNLVVSAMILKAVGAPLARLFRPFYVEAHQVTSAVGKLGKVLSSEINATRIGQIEIITAGAPVVVNAVTEGEDALHKGDEAVVIEKDAKRNLFLVAPTELSP